MKRMVYKKQCNQKKTKNGYNLLPFTDIYRRWRCVVSTSERECAQFRELDAVLFSLVSKNRRLRTSHSRASTNHQLSFPTRTRPGRPQSKYREPLAPHCMYSRNAIEESKPQLCWSVVFFDVLMISAFCTSKPAGTEFRNELHSQSDLDSVCTFCPLRE